MLDGTFGTKSFQVGSNANETINFHSVLLQDIWRTDKSIGGQLQVWQVLLLQGRSTDTAANGVTTGNYTIAGKSGVATVHTDNDTAETAAD